MYYSLRKQIWLYNAYESLKEARVIFAPNVSPSRMLSDPYRNIHIAAISTYDTMKKYLSKLFSKLFESLFKEQNKFFLYMGLKSFAKITSHYILVIYVYLML